MQIHAPVATPWYQRCVRMRRAYMHLCLWLMFNNCRFGRGAFGQATAAWTA